MATPRLAAIALRHHRSALLLTLSCLILTTSGCKHRRSAMRPVYAGPGVPCSTPGCGPADGQVPSTTPPIIESDSSSVEPRLDPIRPQVDPSLNRSRGVSPPAATDPSGEPDLILPINPNGGVERAPRSNIERPPLNGPSTSRAVPRQASVTRSRVARLGEAVRPFVNDPEELFQPTKADRPWEFVVVHHSASGSGSYDEIDREHRKIQGWDGCGYHFVIGNGTGSPDGQIEVARRWSNQKHGLHSRNGKTPDVNEYGIGICLVGDLDSKPPTPKQVAAAKALVAYLATRYQIPADNVGTHADLADSPTACPGKFFPEEQIFGSKHLAAR